MGPDADPDASIIEPGVDSRPDAATRGPDAASGDPAAATTGQAAATARLRGNAGPRWQYAKT